MNSPGSGRGIYHRGACGFHPTGWNFALLGEKLVLFVRAKGG